MKKWRKFGLSFLVMVLALSFCLSPAFAQEEKLIRTELIKSEPINMLRYGLAGADYVWEIFQRVAESGQPVLLFNGESEAGLEVILFENLPIKNFNLVGGWTLLADQPGKFFWGFEYEIIVAGESIFKRLKPSVYLCEGKVRAGIGFELGIR